MLYQLYYTTVLRDITRRGIHIFFPGVCIPFMSCHRHNTRKGYYKNPILRISFMGVALDVAVWPQEVMLWPLAGQTFFVWPCLGDRVLVPSDLSWYVARPVSVTSHRTK